MHALIVTGGIATGKSSFSRDWLALAPDTVFHDADASVHKLYSDASVRTALVDLFGEEVLHGSDNVDRARIRQQVFQDPSKRKELESILHPRVRALCLESYQQAMAMRATWFLADIPLFFEAGCWKPDAQVSVLVVACSRATQLSRLLQRNPFDNDEAQRIVDAQIDIHTKMAAADFVVWNEGLPSVMNQQIRMIKDCLELSH